MDVQDRETQEPLVEPNGEFAALVETAAKGFAALRRAAEIGELAEVMCSAKPSTGLGAEVVGQILMEVLPLPDAPRLSQQQKIFWLGVAEWLGPDWFDELKRAVAFMDAADDY